MDTSISQQELEYILWNFLPALLQAALYFSVAENGYSTLYGFNVIDGLIYISDAKGFTQASEVSIYTPSGVRIKTFSSGIGTNAFYKN